MCLKHSFKMSYETSHYSAPFQPSTNTYFSAAAAPPQRMYTITSTNTPDTQFVSRTNFSPFHSYQQKAKTYDPLPTKHAEYHFQPNSFLKLGKEGIFVGEAIQIQSHIEKTFEKIFNLPFPNNIKISILNEKKFRKIASHPSTIGVSFNSNGSSILSEIYVLNDSLAKVMLTLGHELGHVLTPTLQNPHNEEAKAYAFSFIWMDTIRQHNIADLKNSFVEELPAHNGLHDKAYNFVQEKNQEGYSYNKVYLELVYKKLTISF